MPTYVIALAFLSLLAVCYVIRTKAFPTPYPGIPYNAESLNTLLGDVKTLRVDSDGLPSWCAKQLTKLQTPVSQVFLGPFGKPVVLIADVGDARDRLTRSEFERSSYIIDRFPLFGGSQIISHTDDSWRTSRGWLKDLLSPRYLHGVAGPSIYRSVEHLIELWEAGVRVAGPGRPFSITQDMRDLALDVMTQFHHGDEFQDLSLPRQIRHVESLTIDSPPTNVAPSGGVTFPHAPQNLFGESVEEIGNRMAAIYTMSFPPRLISWCTKHLMPQYRAWFAEKETFLRRRFRTAVERLQREDPPRNAIDYMVYQEHKASRKDSRQPLFGSQIMIDEAFGNHIAGGHTTSSVMVWIMKYLTENQSVQAQVVESIKESFPQAVAENRLPTSEELMNANLPYIRAVIEETLRLRAAFIIARDTVCDTEVLGHPIPAGTVCLLVCQGVEEVKTSSKERQYPGNSTASLQDFDPERWLVREDGVIKCDGASNAHMAFGLGRRACWGRRLAELEMRMMTAMVMWRFELLPVAPELSSHDAEYDFSYRARQGFIKPRKRVL